MSTPHTNPGGTRCGLRFLQASGYTEIVFGSMVLPKSETHYDYIL